MKDLDIGKKIKYYRQEKKLTQQQLADKIGVSWEMVSRYERGVNEPYKKIDSIANALDVSLLDFFQGEDLNRDVYEIPLFTHIPKDFKFSRENTSFFYTCPKWMYEKDRGVFAIDSFLINKESGVFFVSKKIFPFKKHFVLRVKQGELFVENFKNQDSVIGVVLAHEKKFV